MSKKVIWCLIIAIILLITSFLVITLILKNKFIVTESNIETETNDNSQNNSIEILSIDDFYKVPITQKYGDIRKLEKEYSKEKAQKDNCFVIGAMLHNDYLYTDFMNKYKNKQLAFIRVVQNGKSGKVIIYDIMYDNKSDKIFIVSDLTRQLGSYVINLNKYENITQYSYNDHIYWVAYNGEINEETFNSENVLIITTIN